ncbi:MAG: hypothetical protein ACYS21_17830, partial [Planctomycetota bacterium]
AQVLAYDINDVVCLLNLTNRRLIKQPRHICCCRPSKKSRNLIIYAKKIPEPPSCSPSILAG